jgi:hypothetical protein
MTHDDITKALTAIVATAEGGGRFQAKNGARQRDQGFAMGNQARELAAQLAEAIVAELERSDAAEVTATAGTYRLADAAGNIVSGPFVVPAGTAGVRFYDAGGSQVGSSAIHGQRPAATGSATFTKDDMDRAYAVGREAGFRESVELANKAHYELIEAMRQARDAAAE